MKLNREKIQRMVKGGQLLMGSGGSGSGGSGGGGGTASYAEEAGHALEADHATSATTATNLDANSTDWQKIARKDIAQSIAEVFTFAKGIVSTLVSKFKAGILIGANDDYGINASGDATLNNISGVNISGSGDATIGGDLDIDGNATIDSDLNVGADMTASGKITAAQLIADLLKTPGFAQVAGMIGLGFGVTTDQSGRATLQTDDLVVLGKMIVNALNVREVTYIGGTYLLTPAGSTIAKVMRLYVAQTSQIQYSQYWTTTQSNYSVGYRVMWKADDGTTGTMNYWQVGDQAFCQTFNLTASGQYSTAENRRYWRLVCRVGQVTVDGETFHYADLADIDNVYLYGIPNLFAGRENSSGNAPADGDKVVCLGSKTDTTRQGAIQLTAEGEASIGIYDGINLFTSLSNYEIHYFSKSAVRMNAAYITWKTTGGNETQANFMATTKQAFIGIGNCGIDFTNGAITAKGGKFQMEDENGNATFVLDPQGNLNSKGNAAFGGTIRATNFYNNFCLFSEGGIYSNYGYYCITDYDYQGENFYEGQYYTPTDVANVPASDLSDYFSKNTYEANVINMVPVATSNWGSSPAEARTVVLPDPKTFEGKIIEIYSFYYSMPGSARHAYVSCVVNDSFATLLQYSNGHIIREATGQIPQLTLEVGVPYKFQAVKGYINTSGGQDKWYWLKLQGS